MESLLVVAQAAEAKRKASDAYVAAVFAAVEEYGVSATARAAATSPQAIRQLARRHGHEFTGQPLYKLPSSYVPREPMSEYERNLRFRAYAEVAKARAKGLLPSGPCEVCGTIEKIEAHHDDYSRPLDVRWLCKQHHQVFHRQHGTIKSS